VEAVTEAVVVAAVDMVVVVVVALVVAEAVEDLMLMGNCPVLFLCANLYQLQYSSR